MAERQQSEPPIAAEQMQSPPPMKMDMISYVMALEAALLPCLPARELQAIDRSPHPSHQIDVERHARDFMEAAKKLQLCFIALQREERPTRAEILRRVMFNLQTLSSQTSVFLDAGAINVDRILQEIAAMEEELRTKTELINKQKKLIEGWKTELKEQLNKHNVELERV
ncbi:hypothetical protein M569_03963 [Genlisea aurea]|uniref:Mediator of RNA polymerase II transcription subunit 28 n=1 Tax=Genlisea aurea TaxID=192259 RepID=S8CVF7_9LAMI|nr:hypothetical protein M569_03963 [Genlisea aurea]